jgi:hypothetical protein
MAIPMRDVNEVQRAHDLLVSLALDEKLLQAAVTLESRPYILYALNVLCWVLKHDHNVSFALSLTKLEAALKGLGVTVLDLGSLHEGERLQ